MTPLSRREWLALCLWVSGATRQQIAVSLAVRPSTAREYLARARAKVGAKSRVHGEALVPLLERPDPVEVLDTSVSHVAAFPPSG